jgi:hypothetical protein
MLRAGRASTQPLAPLRNIALARIRTNRWALDM